MSYYDLSKLAPEKEHQEIVKALEDVDSNPMVGTSWYVISRTWWDKWENYMKNPEKADEPGPIDADDILIPEEDYVKDYENESSYDNNILKAGIRAENDFKLVTGQIWRSLNKKYTLKNERAQIKRYSIEVSEFLTQVEVGLRPFKFCYITPINKKQSFVSNVFTVYISRKKDVKSVKAKIYSYYNHVNSSEQLYLKSEIRLWKLKTEMSHSEFSSFISENDTTSTFSVQKTKVEFPGDKLDDYDYLEETEIAHDDIVVAEIRGKEYDAWRFAHNDFYTTGQGVTKTCEMCRRAITGRSYQCGCKKFDYCSKKCHERDQDYHFCKSEFTPKPLAVYQQSENSRMGLTGLQNLGNTCFMASGLQCLSNTPKLTQYFLEKESLDGLVNTDNPLGTGGSLAIEYMRLIKEIWHGTADYYAPWGVKKAIGAYASQFSGFGQNDSQELLSYLLDGVHEDLNGILNKPYLETPDSGSMPEAQLAQISWDNHLKRNQSPIVDLMHGQYRSEVICPNCNRVSITFDPFLMHTVQIPSKTHKVIGVMYVPEDWEQFPTRVYFWLTMSTTVAEIKNKVREALGISCNLVLAQIMNESFGRILEDNDLVKSIKVSHQYEVYAYEVPENTTNDQVVIIDFKEKIPSFSTHHSIHGSSSSSTTNYYKRLQSYSRIIPIPTSGNLMEIQHTIYAKLAYVQGMSVEVTQKIFDQAFPSINLESDEEDLYSLFLVNLQRMKGGNYMYTVEPCDFCGKRNCTNCAMAYTADLTLSDLIRKNRTDRNIRVELVWKRGASTEFQLKEKMNMVHENRESEKESKSQQLKSRKESVDIYDCLRLDSQQKKLEVGNEWYCSVCKDHQLATKQLQIYKLPEVLIVHLKRFKQSGYFTDKIGKKIDFPIEGLDMTPFIAPQSPEGPAIYDLYAVSNHYGSLSFGHYTAFCENYLDGKWYEFDDSSVTPVRDMSEVQTEAAYVLCYRRRMA